MRSIRQTPKITDRISDFAFRRLIARALAKPWDERVPYMGRMVSRYIAPLMGYRQRIEKNLRFIYPQMAEAERREIARAVPDNMGRTMAEMYSGDEFIERFASVEIAGEGLAALEAARAQGRGAVLITGHIGNYEAPRVALISRGFAIEGLYRPMNNPLFNVHYEEMMRHFGPAHVRDRTGLKSLIAHLRRGGVVEMLIDQHVHKQPVLDFLGKPAHTSPAAAELALRNGVPLLCMYGIRKPDGLNFEVSVEAPIDPSDSLTMTQAVNDSLSRKITQNPGQWLWNHRRWRAKGNCP